MPSRTRQRVLPAQTLAGVTLPGGWDVEAPFDGGGDNHGAYSCGYVVRHPRRGVGYLKAFEFGVALRYRPRKVREEIALASQEAEARVLRRLARRRCPGVVRLYASGSVLHAGAVIPYLIFELAQADAATLWAGERWGDWRWACGVIAETAEALAALHGVGVYHQDIKASNLLIMPDGAVRLADFGRAAAVGIAAPHHTLAIPGQKEFAPPELLYGHLERDWRRRSALTDLYTLGATVAWFGCGRGFSALVGAGLPPALHWDVFRGAYGEVFSAVEPATAGALQRAAAAWPRVFRGCVRECLEGLCGASLERRLPPGEESGATLREAARRFRALLA